MEKTKVSFIIIAIIILSIVLFFYFNSSNKEKKEDFTENKSFENLIQYKSESVNDNIDNILRNTELSKYISRIDKNSENGNEQLTIYYDCTVETEVQEYWRNANEKSILEKNSVILFSLIEKLEKIRYEFNVSNKDLIEKYPYLSEGIIKEYDRASINLRYNQDVRNYINNPEEFLNYNIDVNTTEMTIYHIDYYNDKTEKIEITDNEKQEKIKEIIKNQKFEIEDRSIDGMIETILDLHNGYIIAIYNENSDNGEIFEGNIEEYLNREGSEKKAVHKILPRDLIEYVYDIINME